MVCLIVAIQFLACLMWVWCTKSIFQFLTAYKKAQAAKGEETKSNLHFLGFLLELSSIQSLKNMMD